MTSILLYKQATHPWRDGWFPGLRQGKDKDKDKTRLEHPELGARGECRQASGQPPVVRGRGTVPGTKQESANPHGPKWMKSKEMGKGSSASRGAD